MSNFGDAVDRIYGEFKNYLVSASQDKVATDAVAKIDQAFWDVVKVLQNPVNPLADGEALTSVLSAIKTVYENGTKEIGHTFADAVKNLFNVFTSLTPSHQSAPTQSNDASVGHLKAISESLADIGQTLKVRRCDATNHTSILGQATFGSAILGNSGESVNDSLKDNQL